MFPDKFRGDPCIICLYLLTTFREINEQTDLKSCPEDEKKTKTATERKRDTLTESISNKNHYRDKRDTLNKKGKKNKEKKEK